MQKKSLLLIVSSLILMLGVVAGAFMALRAAPASAQTGSSSRVIHVIEHAVTDTVQQFHPGTDSRGDVLGFGNPVFDAQDKHQVASDNGFCIRTTPGVAWECNWTIFLKGGQITVEGPYYDDPKHDSLLAITGGTGDYAEARGQMKLHDHFGDATEYDFTYMLVD